MATSRTRSLDLRRQRTGSQTIVSSGVTTYESTVEGEQRTMNDVVGNFPNVNQLGSHIRFVRRASFSGTNRSASGTPLRIVNGLPSGPFAPPDPWTKFGSALDITAQKAALISALHSSSPASAHVSVPQAIGELKDLPEMVRPFQHLVAPQFLAALAKSQSGGIASGVANVPSLLRGFGNTLIGWAANGYISWRWAWKPMIEDAKRCFQLSDLVEKRGRELERMRRGESIKRSVTIRTRYIVESESNVTLTSSFGPVINATRNVTYQERVWFNCRWTISASAAKSPYIQPLRDRREALALLLGCNSLSQLQTAWELMPWSWFADWFGQVGSILALSTPAFPAYHSDACIMRQTSAVRNYSIIPGTVPAWVRIEQIPFEYAIRKERYADAALWFPALPPVNFPLLDSGKWSILSALACSSVDRGLPAIHGRSLGIRGARRI